MTPSQDPQPDGLRTMSLPVRIALVVALFAALAGAGAAWILLLHDSSTAPAQAAVQTSQTAKQSASPLATTTSSSTQGGGITVSGSGSVSVVPDKADWTFTVSATAASAGQAFSQASDKANALLKAMHGQGVSDKDIQTSSISLSPNYSNATGVQGSRVISYTASSSIDVTTTVAASGALVDAAVKAGASQVDGPSLSPSDTEALYQQALKQAYNQAKGRAQALAADAGVQLGAPLTVTTDDSSGPVLPMAKSDLSAGASMPVSGGEQQVTANVTVTFAIQ